MVKINGKVVGTESFPNNERVVRAIQDDGDLIFEVFMNTTAIFLL